MKKHKKNKKNISIKRVTSILSSIESYIDEARKSFPEITDNMLMHIDGKKIFNVTDCGIAAFDFLIDDRMFQFMMFYKDTGMGFIKVFIKSDDCIRGYVYLGNGIGECIPLQKCHLHHGDAKCMQLFKNSLISKSIGTL